MIYFRRHIQALESQIAQLKEQAVTERADRGSHVQSLELQAARFKDLLAASDRDRRDARAHALESQVFQLKELLAANEREKRDGHIQALELQISFLKEQLAESEKQRLAMLDRVLAKNNVEPIAQPAKSAPADVLTPFGVTDPAVQEAYKESWLKEETQYLMGHLACDEATARAYAEQQYLGQYQAISET